jgi:hypothetical protein
MAERWFGLIEIGLFYGLVLGVLIWQLVKIRRSIAADKAREKAEKDGD